MIDTDSVQEVNMGLPGVFCFRITAEVDHDTMRKIAERMLDVFKENEEVDVLLVFETEETSTQGASLSTEAMETEFKSLNKVRNYVVANAPDQAGGLLETMGKLIPVEARSFDTEADAIEWLYEQPSLAA